MSGGIIRTAALPSAAIVTLFACARLADLEGVAGDDVPGTGGTADAPADPVDVDAPPAPGDSAAPVGGDLPQFVLVCNGTPQPFRECADKRWETAPCPVPPNGNRSVVLANEGRHPIAYIARQVWQPRYDHVPGERSEGPNPEVFGTLLPKETVDLSSVYVGGYVMLVGSVAPFHPSFLTDPKTDEARIPYTKPIGDVATAEMFIAQVTTAYDGGVGPNIGTCARREPLWPDRR